MNYSSASLGFDMINRTGLCPDVFLVTVSAPWKTERKRYFLKQAVTLPNSTASHCEQLKWRRPLERPSQGSLS
jgi:hypothetical protein